MTSIRSSADGFARSHSQSYSSDRWAALLRAGLFLLALDAESASLYAHGWTIGLYKFMRRWKIWWFTYRVWKEEQAQPSGVQLSGLPKQSHVGRLRFIGSLTHPPGAGALFRATLMASCLTGRSHLTWLLGITKTWSLYLMVLGVLDAEFGVPLCLQANHRCIFKTNNILICSNRNKQYTDLFKLPLWTWTWSGTLS